MECLLCYFKSDEQTLKAHYERVHRVDPTNLHFKNLFTADANKNCRYCGRVFADSNQKKNMFFYAITVRQTCSRWEDLEIRT